MPSRISRSKGVEFLLFLTLTGILRCTDVVRYSLGHQFVQFDRMVFTSVPHCSHFCSSLRESCALQLKSDVETSVHCRCSRSQQSEIVELFFCRQRGKHFVPCLAVCGRAPGLAWEAEAAAASRAKQFCSGAVGEAVCLWEAKCLFHKNCTRGAFCAQRGSC